MLKKVSWSCDGWHHHSEPGNKKTLAKDGTIFMSSISILGICYVNKCVHAYSPTNACKSTFVRLIIFKGLKKYWVFLQATQIKGDT